MGNLRGLFGIKRIDRMPNAQMRELCGVKKRVDERNDESVLQWFGHIQRMVYVGECKGSRLVG